MYAYGQAPPCLYLVLEGYSLDRSGSTLIILGLHDRYKLDQNKEEKHFGFTEILLKVLLVARPQT